MMAGSVNAPSTSSCGRLFDAAAAALGICRDRQAYEGEAAMRLEAVVDRDALHGGSGYPFALTGAAIDPLPMWERLLSDIADGTAAGIIAARFHKGLAAAAAALAGRLAGPCGIDTVALSGGCFQNGVLFSETVARLEEQGLTVLSHAAVPANDGGLALGQAAVAAARLIEAAPACA
jgi:hydrogenase maturation protein HypF